jgi:uncharacterized protein (TIGR01370 family)
MYELLILETPMPSFKTSHGTIDVSNWGYQLQGRNGAPLNPDFYASSTHEFVVIDYSSNGRDEGMHSPAQIDAIQNKSGGGVAVSYISIGEASDFRNDWNPAWTTTGEASGSLTALAPHWLGPVNPDWPEGRKVRYWESGWQDEIFNASKTGALDKIVTQGFDGAYLDIVDAYYFWAVEATAAERKSGDPAVGDEKDAASRMIDFIVDMTAHARETNPDFFVIVQNGDFIIDALAGLDSARKAALLDAIGGIAVEDVYLRGGDADENNAFKPDAERIAVLQRDFLGNGKAVFAVDYTNDTGLMGQFVERAVHDGFIPTVAPDRDLDRPFAALQSPASVTESADLVAGTAAGETINGLGGSDWLFGFKGNDKLDGGSGQDHLIGGLGRDTLYGGADRDTFVFNAANETPRGSGSDKIADFQRKVDDLDVSGIDAVRKSATDQAFKWIGKQDFHGRAGELHFRDTGKHGYVEGDTNGDGRADFKILVLNINGLDKGDLIL